MPLEQTGTVDKQFSSAGDWNDADLDGFRVNDEGDLLLKKYNKSKSFYSSINFNDSIKQSGHTGSFSTLVRCTKNYKGDIVLEAPGSNGFSSTGRVEIHLVAPNKSVTRLHQKLYDTNDDFVKIENVKLKKGFLYSFKQTTPSKHSESIKVNSSSWEDHKYNPSNEFLCVLSSNKMELSFLAPTPGYTGGKLDDVLNPLLRDKYLKFTDPSTSEFIPEYFRDFTLQDAVFDEFDSYSNLNIFRMAYNDPEFYNFHPYTSIDNDKKLTPTYEFNTSNLIDTKNEGSVVAEDESKNEALIGFASTEFTNSSYSSTAKSILADLTKKYSSGDNIVLIDDSLNNGYNIKSIIEQNTDLNVDVRDSTIITAEQQRNEKAIVDRYITTATSRTFESLTQKQATFDPTKQSASGLPNPSSVLIKKYPGPKFSRFYTSGVQITTANASTNQSIPGVNAGRIQQSVKFEPKTTKNIYSISFSSVTVAESRPNFASGIRDGEGTVVTDGSGDLTSYDGVVVQEFGSSNAAQEFLNKTPFADMGVVYLDQYGNSSDSFKHLSSIRGNPSTINYIENRDASYGKLEDSSSNVTASNINDPYGIFTILSNKYSDIATISGYSGNSIVSASKHICISDTYGFGKIKFNKLSKDIINEKIWNYGYISKYISMKYVRDNNIKWSSTSGSNTTVDVQVSVDNTNWISVTEGDGKIPTVDDYQGLNSQLFLRVKMSRDNQRHTPKLLNLELLIDQASGHITKATSETLTRSQNIDSSITKSSSIQFQANIKRGGKSGSSIQKSNVSTFTAINSEAEINAFPKTATKVSSVWAIDKIENELGNVVKASMSYDTLNLEIIADESTMNNILRDMIDNSGKQMSISTYEGLAKSIDLTDNNKNSYTIITPNNLQPPFEKQDYTLKSYTEEIADNKANKYNVALEFKRKDPVEPSMYSDDSIQLVQNQTEETWMFSFNDGSGVVTRSVNAEINSSVESGFKLSDVELILSSKQCEVINKHLIYNGSTSVYSTSDAHSSIQDGNPKNKNTISITPPDRNENHELSGGDYVVDNWEIETINREDMFSVTLTVGKK